MLGSILYFQRVRLKFKLFLSDGSGNVHSPQAQAGRVQLKEQPRAQLKRLPEVASFQNHLERPAEGTYINHVD